MAFGCWNVCSCEIKQQWHLTKETVDVADETIRHATFEEHNNCLASLAPQLLVRSMGKGFSVVCSTSPIERRRGKDIPRIPFPTAQLCMFLGDLFEDVGNFEVEIDQR